MPPAAKDVIDASSLELRRVRDRELELKRMRGKISCAECHRLKLKCDKKVPCSSCTRRGCLATCPTGFVPASTPATRLVLASSTPDTERDQRKLISMSERIRALEDALQVESAASSRGLASHPLLAPELLTIKQGVTPQPVDEEEQGICDAFGTLSVSEGTSMRFLGASATEQSFLMELFDSHNPVSQKRFSFPPWFAQTNALWPLAPLNLPRETLIEQIIAQLPPLERATALYEAYFTILSWSVTPVDRQQVVCELVPLFYHQHHPTTDCLHDLTLLLAIFACGAAADLTQPPCNPEAERYSELARATLSLDGLFHIGASLSGTQAIILLGLYEVYAAHSESFDTAQEAAWKLISLGLTLASSIGLHRDPVPWKLGPNMVQRRRSTFWEIYLIDHFQSLHTGRPPVFPASVVDCEFPIDDRAIIDENGNIVQSVRYWRYRFGRDVLPHLTEKLCTARPLRYSEILELDRRVGDFDTVPLTRPSMQDVPKPNFIPRNNFLHPLVTVWYKDTSLLHIHRNFFARAMLESPCDPLHSPFARSFLATYCSATRILEIIRNHYDRLQLVFLRVWDIWTLAVTCAVVVGSVVARGAMISFASSAFVELELTITLFEQTTAHPVAKRCLPFLLRIHGKAQHALYRSHISNSSQPGVEGSAEPETTKVDTSIDHTQFPRHSLSVPVPRYDADSYDGAGAELHILRGTTRVVEQRNSSARTYMSSPSASTSSLSSEASPESSSSASGHDSRSTSTSEPSSRNIRAMANTRERPGRGSSVRAGQFADMPSSSLVQIPATTEAGRHTYRGSTGYEGAAQAYNQTEAWTYGHASSSSFPDAEMDVTQTLSAELEQKRVNAMQFASHPQFQQQQQWPDTTCMIQGPCAECPPSRPSFDGPSSSFVSTGDRNLGMGFDHTYPYRELSTFMDPALDTFTTLRDSSAPIIYRDQVAHSQREGKVADAASAEAWHVFMQQSGFLDRGPKYNSDISLSGWEGASFG